MALVPVFHGTVTEDGKVVFVEAEQPRRQAYLRSLAGRAIDVVIKLHRERRSDKQNKWWWGIAVPLIAHELGYDKHEHEAVHYALVAKCFGTKVDPVLKQGDPERAEFATDDGAILGTDGVGGALGRAGARH